MSDGTSAPNPWRPISDPLALKHLGKLAEELGEASAAVARCIIQGVDEAEPVTGKVNREWLEDELADVFAAAKLVTQHFGLDQDRMIERRNRKVDQLIAWHQQSVEPTSPPTHAAHAPHVGCDP